VATARNGNVVKRAFTSAPRLAKPQGKLLIGSFRPLQARDLSVGRIDRCRGVGCVGDRSWA
jgi:hypothetical protein